MVQRLPVSGVSLYKLTVCISGLVPIDGDTDIGIYNSRVQDLSRRGQIYLHCNTLNAGPLRKPGQGGISWENGTGGEGLGFTSR